MYVITPSSKLTTTIPESRAACASRPVPISGLSGYNNGTACLCILDPISALFASSCSKKGINEVAIDITCIGETAT